MIFLIFLNVPSYGGFVVASSKFAVLSPPHHVPTLQALEGAPSDQLIQQSQMPQYYAQQPWVPQTSNLSQLTVSPLLTSPTMTSPIILCQVYQL